MCWALKHKAERARFELAVTLLPRRFSRPVHSTALTPLLYFFEVRARIGLAHNCFADSRVTTSPTHRILLILLQTAIIHNWSYNDWMNKIFLLILFIFAKSIYVVLNKRKSKYYWKIKFDDFIPLIPIFIIPYIGFYIYIITTIIFLWNTKYINNFFITYIIAYILAGLFWYFIPNGVKRPVIYKRDIFSKLTAYIYKHDDDTNGFPSAHIFATLICSYFLFLAFPEQLFSILATALLISASTVFVKQHYILDIFGGIITFWLSLMISGLFGKI